MHQIQTPAAQLATPRASAPAMAAPERLPRHHQASWQQGEWLSAGEATQPVSAQAHDSPAAITRIIDSSSEDGLVEPPPASQRALTLSFRKGPVTAFGSTGPAASTRTTWPV